MNSAVWPHHLSCIMSEQDDFEPRLGRMKPGGKARSARFASLVIGAANLAGGRAANRSSRGRFTGSRVGRGSGMGAVLGSRPRKFDQFTRRVVVKASIVRLGAKRLARASAHLRYLQRDGTTREGDRGSLYSADLDTADGKHFVERGEGDRHQFRFIVAPEDGAEYEDLKTVVRRLMEQAERDLDTRLDWVAVDHFNTGHPHAHVIVRGKDEFGKDLVIARNYLSQGLRERASDIINVDLGPRTQREIDQANAREVEQERFTGLDRRILASRDRSGMVDPWHREAQEQDLRLARLRRLERLGLAEQSGSGLWRVHDELETALRRMGERGDIIRTMNCKLRAALIDRSPRDHAIYDPQRGDRLVGRLVTVGLADEHVDRRYLILDAIDGRSHYVDLGGIEIDARPGAVLAIGARQGGIRQADRTVVEVAAANDGRYTVDHHLRHDRNATQAFAETHVRRLEAIRRTTGRIEREPDGTWRIADDHLTRVEEHERSISARSPVVIETLSIRSIDKLPGHDGATWLDRELMSDKPERLESGFGEDVRKALERRRQWLIAQGFAQDMGNGQTGYRADLSKVLERRELNRVGAVLAREIGSTFAQAATGERVEGKVTRMVEVGDRKFALIERSRDFTLVPWRPELERQIGRDVSGIIRGDGSNISWTIGRQRGIGISM